MAAPTRGSARDTIPDIRTKWAWLLPLLLVVIILLVFSNSAGHEFIWDDTSLILQNRFIQDPGNLPQLFTQDLWAFTREPGIDHDLYRPLVSVSYLIDFHFWGARPFPYHFSNLLFHVLSSLTVYLILREILGEMWPAWLGALLFAITPIQTESVTWISGRASVICGFFYFLAFLLYLYHRKRDRWGYLIGSLVAFLLALLSNEIAITLPIVIFVYVLCFDDAPWRGRWEGFSQTRYGRALIEALPYLAVVVLYLAVRVRVLGFPFYGAERAMRIQASTSALGGIGATLLLAAKVVALYLRLLVLPYPLNAHRLASDLESTAVLLDWLAPVVVVAVLVLSILALRRAPTLAFAGLFFFATILPVSWLLAVGDMVPERFLYIPSLAICLVVAWLVASLWQQRRAWGVALALLISLLWVVLTFNRNADWRNNLTLWSRTVAASPQSTLAHNSLGLEFLNRGQYEKAIAEFDQVLKIDQENQNAYINLGAAYATQEQYQEAAEALQKAIELVPERALPHFHLGIIFERLGDTEQAIVAYQNALDLDPYLVSAYYNLGLAYHSLERWAEAIFVFERLLDIEPNSAEAHNSLGLVYLQLQLFPQAIYEFQEALQLDPQSAPALSNLGLAYLNNEQIDRAIPPLERAAEIAPDFAPARFNLGVAYLESGFNDKALVELAIAAELDPDNEEARRLIKEIGGQ
jgi:tetratricopeptide (TPR) repeat protein